MNTEANPVIDATARDTEGPPVTAAAPIPPPNETTSVQDIAPSDQAEAGDPSLVGEADASNLLSDKRPASVTVQDAADTQSKTGNKAPREGARRPRPSRPKGGSSTAASGGVAQSTANGGLIGLASGEGAGQGWLSAAGGSRRLFPEMALPFTLPTAVPQRGQTSRLRSPIGDGSDTSLDSDDDGSRTSRSRARSTSSSSSSSDTSGTSSETDSDTSTSSELSIEATKRQRRNERQRQRNLIYVQSMRQSRLFHLTSRLPMHSYRLPNGRYEFPRSVGDEHLNGFKSERTDQYVIAPLGSVKLQCGPHVFHNTRVWEVRTAKRTASAAPPISTVANNTQDASEPSTQDPAAPASENACDGGQPIASGINGDGPGKDVPNAPTAMAMATPTPTPQRKGTSKPRSVAAKGVTTKGSTSTPKSKTATPSSTKGPNAARSPAHSTSASMPPPQPPSVGVSPKPPPPASQSQPGTPGPPPAAAAASVDPALVARVNARAAHSPQLRDLLQVAARGVASADQLRTLGVVIQQVTQEMEAEGHKVKIHCSPPPTTPTPTPGSHAPAKSSAQKSSSSGSQQRPEDASRPADPTPSSSSTKAASSPQAPSQRAEPDQKKTTKARKSGGRSKKEKGNGASQQEDNSQVKERTPDAKASQPASSSSLLPDSDVGTSMKTPNAEATSTARDSYNVKATTAAASVAPTPAKARKTNNESSTPRKRGAPVISEDIPPPLTGTPVLLIEFSENPGVLFYLPLWALINVAVYSQAGAHATAELYLHDREDAAKLSSQNMMLEARMEFLMPRSGHLSSEDDVCADQAVKTSKCLPHAVNDSAVSSAKDDEQTQTESEGQPLEQAQTSKSAPAARSTAQANDYPLHITAMSMQASDEKRVLLQAFARVPGVKGLESLGVEASAFSARPNEGDIVSDKAAAHLCATEEMTSKAIANLPPRQLLNVDGAVPGALADHLHDAYVPQVVSVDALHTAAQQQTASSKRSYRRMQNAAIPSARGVGLVRDEKPAQAASPAATAATASAPVALPLPLPVGDDGGRRKKRQTVNDLDQAPRKKRHVATHNPDGSLKLCQHCGASHPPMWRRGPDGPGTLCNACGSKYKTGRIVVKSKYEMSQEQEQEAAT